MTDQPADPVTEICVKIPFLHLEVRATRLRDFVVAFALLLLGLCGILFYIHQASFQEGRLALQTALTRPPQDTPDLKKLSDLVSDTSQPNSGSPPSADLTDWLLIGEDADTLAFLAADSTFDSADVDSLRGLLRLQSLGLARRTDDGEFELTPAGRSILHDSVEEDGNCDVLPPALLHAEDWSEALVTLEPVVAPLQLDTPVDGTFAASACHLYSIQVSEAGEYEIQTTFPPGDTGFADTVLYLIEDESGQLIAFDDDGGVGRLSRITKQLEADTLYQLVVASFSSLKRGSYGLELALSAQDARIDVESLDAWETMVAGAGAITGSLAEGTEELWFELELLEAGPYRIETLPTDDSASAVDTVIHLYREGDDGFMVLVGEDDDGKGDETRLSILREELDPHQTYFLRLTSFWGESGAFRLAMAPLQMY